MEREEEGQQRGGGGQTCFSQSFEVSLIQVLELLTMLKGVCLCVRVGWVGGGALKVGGIQTFTLSSEGCNRFLT